ncbi:MAG: cardiolipin synthase, partial [Planctomycetia bacterium]
RLLARLVPFGAVGGNHVELFTDMEENYRRQLAAIDAAQSHVHLEYYIVRADDSGRRFQQAMIAAAQRGVKVRFLYDGVGTMGLATAFLDPLRAAGVETAVFFPVSPFDRRWNFNFRSHRKILVVDGRVAFTGGANIGDEYLGKSTVGAWADAMVRIDGPAVLQLQRVFVEDWASAHGEGLDDADLYPAPTLGDPPAGGVVGQVVPGGPDGVEAVYHELFFEAVGGAERRVRVTTPYLVPSEAVLTALRTAARRGVQVQLVVPGVSTHYLVQLAAHSYYEELARAGVEVWEYTRGFMHSKILTVDDRWSLVGSANLDNRSMKLNFEVGVLFYDAAVTGALDQAVDRYLADGRLVRLAEWKRRGLAKRLGENTLRLFSSIL